MAYVEKRGKTWRVRYVDGSGTLASVSGFPTKTSADAAAKSVEADQRRGTFLDPRGGELTVGEWVTKWRAVLNVSAATEAKYDVFLRRHILPAFGNQPLRTLTRLNVRAWVNSLRLTHKESSVAGIASLLSSILAEAVEERLLPANPCQRLRLGAGTGTGERPFADEYQVALIANGCGEYSLMVLLVAYTGLRWGEAAGLRRQNVALGSGVLHVRESLHEVNGTLSMGRPKTAAAIRKVTLPPFLVDLLAEHMANMSGDFLFTGDKGGWLRRSNFNRRIWTPAVAGVMPGLHFHDLRHTHKTWLLDDGVPDVARDRRLGHKRAGASALYEHVTPAMEQRLLDGLQARWERTQVLPAAS